MYPVLFNISGIKVRTGEMIWLLSAILFMLWTRNRGEKLYGIPSEIITKSAVVSFLGAALGAALFGALESYRSISESGGLMLSLSSSGAILFGMTAMFAASKIWKMEFITFCDCASIPAAFAIALWRIGCLMEGCCKGISSESRYACFLYPGEIFRRIPYPMIEFVYSVICVLILQRVEKMLFKRDIQGRGIIFAASLVLYGYFRLATDFLREDGLTSAGTAAFTAFAIGGTIGLIYFIRKFRKQTAK